MRARCSTLSAVVLVVVCATWAYRVNYATQEAMDRVADLRAADRRRARGDRGAEGGMGLSQPARPAAGAGGRERGGAGARRSSTPDQFGEVSMVAVPAGTRPTFSPPRSPRAAGVEPVIRRPLRPLARILARPRRGQGPRPRRGRGARRAAGGAAPRRAGQGRDTAPAPRGGLHPRLLDRRRADGAGLGGGAGRAARRRSPAIRSTPSAPTSSTATARCWRPTSSPPRSTPSRRR